LLLADCGKLSKEQVSMKSNKKKWLKVIEFTIVGIATWLNPSAGGLLFLLKLCFQILAALQKPDEVKTKKTDRK
jgi:hypothetical protein